MVLILIYDFRTSIVLRRQHIVWHSNVWHKKWFADCWKKKLFAFNAFHLFEFIFYAFMILYVRHNSGS